MGPFRCGDCGKKWVTFLQLNEGRWDKFKRMCLKAQKEFDYIYLCAYDMKMSENMYREIEKARGRK